MPSDQELAELSNAIKGLDSPSDKGHFLKWMEAHTHIDRQARCEHGFREYTLRALLLSHLSRLQRLYFQVRQTKVSSYMAAHLHERSQKISQSNALSSLEVLTVSDAEHEVLRAWPFPALKRLAWGGKVIESILQKCHKGLESLNLSCGDRSGEWDFTALDAVESLRRHHLTPLTHLKLDLDEVRGPVLDHWFSFPALMSLEPDPIKVDSFQDFSRLRTLIIGQWALLGLRCRYVL